MHFKRILKISRPHFWIYELGPYLVWLAAGMSAVTDLWQISVIVFGLYFLFSANLWIYGVNDIYDYETDKLNPKKSEYEALVHPREHPILRKNILIAQLPFVFFLTSWEMVWWWLIFLFFSGFYSALPIRAKTIPLVDSVFSAGHYVATAVFAYVLIGGAQIDRQLVIAGMAWAMAMHAYSALPDIQPDQEAWMQTTATALGYQMCLRRCMALYLLATACSYQVLGPWALVFGVIYLALMIASIEEKKIFPLYKLFPWINTLVGFSIFWIVVLR